jgi:hypothetical protein
MLAVIPALTTSHCMMMMMMMRIDGSSDLCSNEGQIYVRFVTAIAGSNTP